MDGPCCSRIRRQPLLCGVENEAHTPHLEVSTKKKSQHRQCAAGKRRGSSQGHGACLQEGAVVKRDQGTRPGSVFLTINGDWNAPSHLQCKGSGGRCARFLNREDGREDNVRRPTHTRRTSPRRDSSPSDLRHSTNDHLIAGYGAEVGNGKFLQWRLRGVEHSTTEFSQHTHTQSP